jgi:hypothetical protein
VDGRALHFRLAGINNQNFLMRDEETGTWWQQITGRAIFGPLKGKALQLFPNDELTFGLWKQESPAGQVLLPIKTYEKEYEDNWEPEVAKMPTPLNFSGSGLQNRDVVIGMDLDGHSRAYPLSSLSPQAPVQDRLGSTPILLAMAPDNKSVRVFITRVEGQDIELFRENDSKDWLLMDSTFGSEWNFQGCAINGPAQGKCLEPLPALKDYWFDWRNYHPETTVYKH